MQPKLLAQLCLVLLAESGNGFSQLVTIGTHTTLGNRRMLNPYLMLQVLFGKVTIDQISIGKESHEAAIEC